MDAELALWMSNISQIDSGSFVFDPFVGSGSLLLTSAHYGQVDNCFRLLKTTSTFDLIAFTGVLV